MLVVQPAFLGDAVFLGPAVRALLARWPAAEVALCVTPRGAAVARHLPGCARVEVYDKRGADAGLRGFARVARRLRAFRPDLALVPHRSLRSGALALASGAERRVGYAPLCTERLALDRRLPFVDRTLALVARAGWSGVGSGGGGEGGDGEEEGWRWREPPAGDPALALEPPPEQAAYAARALAGLSAPLVGLVPGAEWETKRWPEERWAGLAALLSARGAALVLLGGPAERALAGRVASAAGVPVRDTTGNTVEEALAILARCDLVVGGDTGLVHCARALARPTVALFGPTAARLHHFTARERAITLGLPCQPCHAHGPRRCPLGHHRCLGDLQVTQVGAAAAELLRPAAGAVDGPGGRGYGPPP